MNRRAKEEGGHLTLAGFQSQRRPLKEPINAKSSDLGVPRRQLLRRALRNNRDLSVKTKKASISKWGRARRRGRTNPPLGRKCHSRRPAAAPSCQLSTRRSFSVVRITGRRFSSGHEERVVVRAKEAGNKGGGLAIFRQQEFRKIPVQAYDEQHEHERSSVRMDERCPKRICKLTTRMYQRRVGFFMVNRPRQGARARVCVGSSKTIPQNHQCSCRTQTTEQISYIRPA